ncbi:lactonase family protein [Luteibacter yeojuensis]|uniref:Lactonase family protein n=1 Tax=Luteibacter yeojuensis TaxID=345309 RepID=A0A7X5QSY3_9GAMM|nr:beta-propeller fold lactonase family protein [Luteibacter yeojuensis]NID14730.1 lactonase family protein [Luteibacter yeojuensis]
MHKQHVLAMALVATAAGASAASAQQADLFGFGPHDGSHVYVMSNDKDQNSVAVLKRDRIGHLDKVGVYRTGGKGVGVGTTAPPPDPLGSQNALLLSDDGHLLFAVDAGSNEISTFLVLGDRLVLIDVTDSGGSYPVSLAQHGSELYVLNSAGEANVTAFRIGPFGFLSKVRGSTRLIGTDEPLVGNQPNVGNTATQLQFDRTGRWLAISVKDSRAKGFIEVFGVDRSGELSRDPAITPSMDPAAFGFTFDDHDHLLISEAGGNAVSSYSIERNGELRVVSQSVPTGQGATCWLAANHRYAVTANAGSNTLTAFRVDAQGHLTLTSPDGLAANLGAGHAPTDIKFSSDGRSLYVNTPGTGGVSAFAVRENGELVPLGETPVFAAFSGMQGLAVQ